MVRLSDSGPLVFRFVSVGFRFRRWCRNFVGSGEIWPIFGQIRRIWTRSRRNIAGSGGFQIELRRKRKNIANICHFLSEYVWMSPDVLIWWSGRVARVFGEETRQLTRRVRVLCVTTHRRPSDWSVRVVAGWFRAGPAGWSGDKDPWTPLSMPTSASDVFCLPRMQFSLLKWW